MDEQTHGRMTDGRKEGRKEGRMDGWMDGWMDGRKEGRKEGRKDGWMEGRKEDVMTSKNLTTLTWQVGKNSCDWGFKSGTPGP